MRFSSEFVVKFEVGHRRPARLAHEWIEQRWKDYRDGAEREKLKERHQQAAFAARFSMFDNLARQVEGDVQHYNTRFASEPKCKAAFEWSPGIGLFTIQANNRTLAVQRENDTTVIRVDDVSATSGATMVGRISSTHFEISPDDQGDIRYRQDGEFLDAEQASQRILSPLLC
jgi:hypothetical protein